MLSTNISTFEQAIRWGNVATWTEIESLNLRKVLGTMISIESGHLDQEKKTLQTTKVIEKLTSAEVSQIDELCLVPTTTKKYEYFCPIDRNVA